MLKDAGLNSTVFAPVKQPAHYTEFFPNIPRPLLKAISHRHYLLSERAIRFRPFVDVCATTLAKKGAIGG